MHINLSRDLPDPPYNFTPPSQPSGTKVHGSRKMSNSSISSSSTWEGSTDATTMFRGLDLLVYISPRWYTESINSPPDEKKRPLEGPVNRLLFFPNGNDNRKYSETAFYQRLQFQHEKNSSNKGGLALDRITYLSSHCE